MLCSTSPLFQVHQSIWVTVARLSTSETRFVASNLKVNDKTTEIVISFIMVVKKVNLYYYSALKLSFIKVE